MSRFDGQKALLTDIVSGIVFEVNLKKTHRIETWMSWKRDGCHPVRLSKPMTAKQSFFFMDRPFLFKVWDRLSGSDEPVIDEYVITDVTSELLTTIAMDQKRPYLYELILIKIDNLKVVELTEKFKEKDKKTKKQHKEK